jgi:diguanylate cyclase (GGDEF)-like protein/PAS domain S-box-containing protein
MPSSSGTNNSGEAVLTLDTGGRITSWDEHAAALFGYSELEAFGAQGRMLTVDGDAGTHVLAPGQGNRAIDTRLRKKSGEIFWANVSLGDLHDTDQRVVGLIASVRDINTRKLAELQHLAYYDASTGLPNRSLFNRLVDQAVTVAQRNVRAGCVLFIKLKRLEPVDATLDGALDEALLQRVAQRFRRALREEDILARLGADEFAVALFDIRQHFEATPVAQKLQAALGAAFVIDEHAQRFKATIGISVFPHDASGGENLLGLAESAMQRAVNDAGRDEQVAFYSREMNVGMQRRMRVEAGLRHALGHGELLLHYQPKFALGSARLVGAEALVRWLHPERGLLLPAEFIPLAESTGLIVKVGEWVLEAACAQAAIWQHAGLAPFRLAINVSRRELNSDLPLRLANTLGRYRLDPQWIGLELGGSDLMREPDSAIALMQQIHKLGVGLSIDDFGSACLSLACLQRLPALSLAIDRAYVAGLPDGEGDCAIIGAVIGVGQQLKHKVIAKGVETVEQYECLQRIGCGEAQGYLFSRPLPADEFERALRENWLLVE